MRKRIAVGLFAVAAGLLVMAGGPTSFAQDKKVTAPKHLYGHDLRVRPGGNPNFGPETPRIGVELFYDDATKALIAISETGSLSVSPATPVGADKTCQWKTAHDLNCRKAGEAEFTQKTKKWGVELFQDRGTNRLLYVCESGSVALAPVPPGLVSDRGPKWHHALEPKVRAPEQDKFDNAKKIGLEVFKDENTGGLIYVTEIGAIATASTNMPQPEPKAIKAPKTQYGLVLRVRGAEEPNFTEKTKQMGVEVFEDPNAGVLFYLTEGGFIATAPYVGKFVPDARSVTWKGAMALRARKGGQKDFDKAQKFGIEVFEDNRTGNLLFVSETGSIAVLRTARPRPTPLIQSAWTHPVGASGSRRPADSSHNPASTHSPTFTTGTGGAARSFAPSSGETVNTSSKSSPSPSACWSSVRPDVRLSSRAASEIGTASAMSTAPHPLSSQMWLRSAARPSLMSHIACNSTAA
jgi:hypothetical protein